MHRTTLLIQPPRASAAPCAAASHYATTRTSATPGSRARSAALCALVASSLVLAGCSDKKEAPAAKGPTEVGVVTLKAERQAVTVELSGRTSAYQSAEIRPQIGGIVQKRLFTEGANVKAGQVLYQLDDSSYRAAQASAQAAAGKVQAALGTTELNARRNAELVKIDAVSRQVADESEAALVQARSDVGVAKAALDNARITLGYARITAPISGRIGTSSVTPGALVTAAQTTALTTIQQLDPLYVDVTQSSTEVLRLKADLAKGRFQRSGDGEARFALKLEDGSKYPIAGRLRFAGVSVDPGTGAVTLRGVVPNPDGLLMPGMYVRAVLEAGVNENAVLVPQQGLTRDTAGNASVLVLTADNKVEKRKVQIDAAVSNRWQVANGLKAGERVVIDGLQRVKPGDTVKPVEAVPGAPAVAGSAPGASAPAGAASGTSAGASAPSPAALASSATR